MLQAGGWQDSLELERTVDTQKIAGSIPGTAGGHIPSLRADDCRVAGMIHCQSALGQGNDTLGN